METNPVISAYLDAEKRRMIALINEADVKFALWLSEFEKNANWEGPRSKASVGFGDDRAEFDILPGEGIKKTVCYCRSAVAFEKKSSLVYLKSVFENLREEYSDKPDFVEDILKLRIALIEKMGLSNFFGTSKILQNILIGHNPSLKSREN